MKNYDTFTTELMQRDEENRNFKKKMKEEVIKTISDRLDYLGVKELTLWYNDDYRDPDVCYYKQEDLDNLDEVNFYFGGNDYKDYNIIRYVAKDEKGVWVADSGPNAEEFYLDDPDARVSLNDVLNLLEYLEHVTPEMIEDQRIGEESAKFNM